MDKVIMALAGELYQGSLVHIQSMPPGKKHPPNLLILQKAEAVEGKYLAQASQLAGCRTTSEPPVIPSCQPPSYPGDFCVLLVCGSTRKPSLDRWHSVHLQGSPVPSISSVLLGQGIMGRSRGTCRLE